MTSDFLKTQLRLLVAQFGRKAVLDALAAAVEAAPEQIQDEIAKLKLAHSTKSSKRDKPLDELLADLPLVSGRSKELLAQLGRMFQAKQFLPNLRDAEEFLRRGGTPERKYKNRKAALAPVLKRLCELPDSELESLVTHSTSGISDFAVLANQLMGKK